MDKVIAEATPSKDSTEYTSNSAGEWQSLNQIRRQEEILKSEFLMHVLLTSQAHFIHRKWC